MAQRGASKFRVRKRKQWISIAKKSWPRFSLNPKRVSRLSVTQMDIDRELLLKSFVSETGEGLAQMEEALLELE